MFTKPTDGGPAAATLPPHIPPYDAPLPVILREHLHRLRLIHSASAVAVMALHRQDAEQDHDVAMLLDHHINGELEFEIEVLEATLNTLVGQRAPKKVAA